MALYKTCMIPITQEMALSAVTSQTLYPGAIKLHWDPSYVMAMGDLAPTGTCCLSVFLQGALYAYTTLLSHLKGSSDNDLDSLHFISMKLLAYAVHVWIDYFFQRHLYLFLHATVVNFQNNRKSSLHQLLKVHLRKKKSAFP